MADELHFLSYTIPWTHIYSFLHVDKVTVP